MAQVRKIIGLEEAGLAQASPYPVPRKLKGSKAAGLAYERKFGKALPGILEGTPFAQHSIHAGQWIEFRDAAGAGFAQPDFYLLPPLDSILLPDFGIILETKLSINTRGWFQLEKLYLPLLRKIYRIDFKLILVCKNMRPGFSEYPMLDVIEPLVRDTPAKSVWQWLGN